VDKKSGKLVDLPVTFHTRIKSSGYGQVPQDSFARKQLQKQKAKERQQQSLRSTSAGGALGGSAGTNVRSHHQPNSHQGVRIRSYPTERKPMTLHQPHNTYPYSSPTSVISALSGASGAPVYRIQYSEDASMLGLATTDTAVSVLKMPVSRHHGDGVSYMGHNNRITDICFSHNKEMVLSASADGTARIWKGGRVDSAAVLFSHYKHHTGIASTLMPTTLTASTNISSSSSSSSSSSNNTSSGSAMARNKPYAGEILAARFYYMDKFVALAIKSQVLLYTYEMEPTSSGNDLKRLHSNGKYQQAHGWQLPSHNVTAMACVNSVQSPILFAASSDRKLYVLDAAAGAIARVVESAHDRSIHCIALPQPSMHVQLPSSSYGLFATAGMDNLVALWDLRQPRCVARYTGHVNRREPVGIALSPCLRYLATGSEDKTARIIGQLRL